LTDTGKVAIDRDTVDGETALGPLERRTLESVCDAILPALVAVGLEDPALFGTSARDVGTAAELENSIGSLPPAQHAEFRLLLRALEQPIVIGLLAGRLKGFSKLSLDGRERVLLRMATSPVPQLRAAFQGLKRLSTFLYYSARPGGRHNPAWSRIGYRPSPESPATAAALTVTPISRDVQLSCDVCIIGSGAGGSVIAAELAAVGQRVIVLEAGGGEQAPDYTQRELESIRGLFLDNGLGATADLGLSILAGGTLGGGTVVNWQTSLRLPDIVREEWSSASGCAHFAGDAFTRSLDAVCARIGAGTGESTVNANNDVLRRGCEQLGWHHSSIPRNSRGCDAGQCGYCIFGCRHGGKQSAAVTFLRDAQSHGNTVIHVRCHADRVRISAGQVTGVDATGTDPATRLAYRVTVNAPRVVVAAGSMRSPLVLLRSGISLPAIGRNLHVHPASPIAGIYPEPIEPFIGPPQTILSDQFAAIDGAYGFKLEAAPVHPGLLALALPWQGARDHRRRMQRFGHTAALIAFVRDRSTGEVSIGRNGQTVTRYQPGTRELAHLRRGIAAATRVHAAAGADTVVTLHQRDHTLRAAGASARAIDEFCERVMRDAVDRNWSPLFSAHQMGTCRMGRSAQDAVCDERGAVFGVRGLFIGDASAFPLSSGVNPMVTIMAMAHHTAQAIKDHA